MISLAQALDTLAPGVPYSPPANWLQGRTAYGGLSAAMAHHVALRLDPAGLPPLKAAQFSFIGPVADATRFEAELLRRGKSVTQVGVDARVGDALATRASFVFGSPRSSTIRHDKVQRPDVQAPNHYRSLPGDHPAPGHFQNFDVRFVGDATPVSGSPEPQLLAWVRLKESEGVHPASALLALGDCLPPASMACFTAPAPISSMTWSVDFPCPAAPSEWFLQRSRSLVAADGYSFQLMVVWNERGELVLLSTQTVAIFV
jgi:acyl-CoA thioesterase